jgi:hypothetical protein
MSDVERIDLPSGQTIFYRDASHSYWTGHDEKKGTCSGRIPGVSTIAKALDSNPDPLVTWGAKLTAQGVCELLAELPADHVLDVLEAGGDNLHDELREAKLDWRSLRDKRASEGTAVHEQIFAALGRGDRPNLSDLSDEERGYGQAAFRFWSDTRPKPLAVEQAVFIPDLPAAGRFDLLAEVDGEVVLYDLKTSKRDYLAHHVQLAGYAIGCDCSGLPAPERTMIVLIRPDGSWHAVEGVCGPQDFIDAHTAYTAGKRVGKNQRDAERRRVAVAA